MLLFKINFQICIGTFQSTISQFLFAPNRPAAVKSVKRKARGWFCGTDYSDIEVIEFDKDTLEKFEVIVDDDKSISCGEDDLVEMKNIYVESCDMKGKYLGEVEVYLPDQL